MVDIGKYMEILLSLIPCPVSLSCMYTWFGLGLGLDPRLNNARTNQFWCRLPQSIMSCSWSNSHLNFTQLRQKNSQNEPQLKVPGIWSILATIWHECGLSVIFSDWRRRMASSRLKLFPTRGANSPPLTSARPCQPRSPGFWGLHPLISGNN